MNCFGLSVSASFSVSQDARGARSSLLIIVLLALLLGLQPLTTDLYLPALPALGAQLHSSAAQAQTTFFALLLAFGLSQLLWGPVSDRWGRRPVLLVGLALYVVAALGCAMAPSMQVLIAWRAVQGVAMGAGVMCARAVVRDLYAPVEGAQVMSKALTGLGAIACSSPVVGSWLASAFGWRSTMLALAFFGMLVWLLVWRRFEESVQREHRQPLHLGLLWRNWRHIASHPTFWAYTSTTSASYAGLVVLLASASFTFIGVLGWQESDVGWLLASNGGAYIAGTIACQHLVRRMGVRQAVAIAAGLALVCALVLIACAVSGVQSGLAYAAPCLLFSIAHGIAALWTKWCGGGFPPHGGYGFSLEWLRHDGGGLCHGSMAGPACEWHCLSLGFGTEFLVCCHSLGIMDAGAQIWRSHFALTAWPAMAAS